MKRQFALLLSVLMVFSLCACGKSHENMSKTPCNSKDMRGEAYEKAVEAFGLNAIIRCRSKNMGFIGMIKRVACLVAQRRNDIRQTDIRWNPGVRSLPK